MGGCAAKQKSAAELNQGSIANYLLDSNHDNQNLSSWTTATAAAAKEQQQQAMEQRYRTRPLPPIMADHHHYHNQQQQQQQQQQYMHSQSHLYTSSPFVRQSEQMQLHQLQQQQQLQFQLQKMQQQQQQLQPGAEIVAKFHYAARTDGELSFCAGDSMKLLDVINPDWWYVQLVQTAACGYAPAALLAVKHSLNENSWYFGPLSRQEAERMLLAAGNRCGAFLIRDSGSLRDSYSLSVLESAETVKHYRVRILHGNGTCCITTRRQFTSLQSLVDFYRNSAEGLCCKLQQACQRAAPLIGDLCYETRDQWEIPRQQLKLLERLGSGQFGEVWRALFNDKIEVAVKTLKVGTMPREEFLSEAKVMKQLRHPKLVQLFAVCTDADPIFIVTELMQQGCLLQLLRAQSESLSLNSLLDISVQVASGMAYLESQQFVHRDLAARNILIGENNVAKVADFGLSRAIDCNGEYNASEGAKLPIKWTSPEAALHGRFSVKSDVWSFGIVLFETFSRGTQPYAGMSNTETLRAVATGYRLEQPIDCPDLLYATMQSCWHSQPELRPTFAHLSDHLEEFHLQAESSYRDTDPETVVIA